MIKKQKIWYLNLIYPKEKKIRRGKKEKRIRSQEKRGIREKEIS